MNIGSYPNRKKDKGIYYYDYGRGPGKRTAIGICSPMGTWLRINL